MADVEAAERRASNRLQESLVRIFTIVGAVVMLVAFLWGGANFVSNRLVQDEERIAAQKAAVEKLQTDVGAMKTDVTETKNDVKWIVRHIDRK